MSPVHLFGSSTFQLLRFEQSASDSYSRAVSPAPCIPDISADQRILHASFIPAERLGIMSAVCTGKGVIFVEAFREAHVKAAVTGIADLYSWKDGAITLVPLPEMTRVVSLRGRETERPLRSAALSCRKLPRAAFFLCGEAHFPTHTRAR